MCVCAFFPMPAILIPSAYRYAHLQPGQNQIPSIYTCLHPHLSCGHSLSSLHPSQTSHPCPCTPNQPLTLVFGAGLVSEQLSLPQGVVQLRVGVADLHDIARLEGQDHHNAARPETRSTIHTSKRKARNAMTLQAKRSGQEQHTTMPQRL